MPSELGTSPLTFRPAEGSGEEIPISSAALQGQKRCKTTTSEESPPSNSVICWSSSRASELFLSYMDGKWTLTRFSTFSPCPGAGGYTTPNCGRNLAGVRAVGGKGLLVESSRTTDHFFLFLPCLRGLCHWVPSCFPFFHPSWRHTSRPIT